MLKSCIRLGKEVEMSNYRAWKEANKVASD